MKILRVLVISMIISFYFSAAYYHAVNVNTNMEFSDQSAYMNATKQTRKQNFKYLGDRARTPLFTHLQAIFYRQGMTDKELFLQGKVVNILLSIIFLIVIYRISIGLLGKLNSTVFVLISGLSVFVLKAGYFQAELLYYFLSFLTFLLFYKSLAHRGWKVGAVAGLFAALSYYAKPSILLGVYIYTLFYLFKAVITYATHKKTKILKFALLSIISFWIVFIATLSPYLADNKKIFGRYFYNVNTNFYIWYDSWEEVVEGTRNFEDRVGWPKMPEDQIPSMSKYLEEHTAEQIADRLLKGLGKLVIVTVNFSNAFIYFLAYLFFSIVMVYFDWKAVFNNISLIKVLKGTFVMAYFVLYVLSFSWFSVFEFAPRFALSLYLPILFTIFYILNKVYFANKRRRMGFIKLSLNQMFNLTIILLLILDAFTDTKSLMANAYFGL